MLIVLKYWKAIALTGLFLFATSYSHHKGAVSERAKWETREKASTAAYNALLLSTQTMYRAIENKRAIEARQLSVKHLNEVKKNEATYQANLAAVRAGTLKLRDQFASRASCGIDKSKVGPYPSRIDIGAGAELSAESSEFLLSEANRADKVVLTLNRCIAQLRADREETPQQTKD